MIPQNPYPDNIAHLAEYETAHCGWARCDETYKSWLFSPCTEHPHESIDQWLKIDGWLMFSPEFIVGDEIFYAHKKDCHECMAELKEGL